MTSNEDDQRALIIALGDRLLACAEVLGKLAEKRMAKLRSPYPWFGGKSKVASIVWRAFGDVPNFVEPFFGSGAMLLARPHWPFTGNRIETVNDLDGMVPNFWRALQAEPDEVAKWTDWPVSECDLHARHLWLVREGRNIVERLKTEPEFYDAKIAGWWVWGLCQWIGSGWCEHSEWKQLPHLGDAGMGVHRPSQQLPHLGNSGRGVHRPGSELQAYFEALSDRLRGVRVCCGDWSRVCGPTQAKLGLTGVFLDPPYTGFENLYAVDHDVAADVRQWCLENGGDKRLRIALCGYAGEGHEVLEANGWTVEAWKARGGYANQGDDESPGADNAARERIWFSPNCLREPDLFTNHD